METEHEQERASAVAEAAHAATVEIADTINDAIQANQESEAPDPTVGDLLAKASVQAEQSVDRTGWIRGWFRRLRRSGP